MSKEYIEKNKLLEDIECIDISDCTDIDDIFTEVEKTIDDQPTADVVEVVRCKNCQYWEIVDVCKGRCNGVENGLEREYTRYDDYCSYGKRKDSADNAAD